MASKRLKRQYACIATEHVESRTDLSNRVQWVLHWPRAWHSDLQSPDEQPAGTAGAFNVPHQTQYDRAW